jgi:hypothetical protein
MLKSVAHNSSTFRNHEREQLLHRAEAGKCLSRQFEYAGETRGRTMSGASNDKLIAADSGKAPRRHGFDWPHALVELTTVVVVILIALTINNWAQARHDAVLETRYLLSIPAGYVVSIALLKIDPVWDPIRNRPDFQQLLSGTEQVGPNK